MAWIAIATVQVIRAREQIANLSFPDPDDVLRLVQVRDLLAGQGWFDLHQYRIDGPAGTLMHWSRLVDIPLALIVEVLTPVAGAGTAERIAVVAVPLLTLGAILLAIAKTASRFLATREVTIACLCAGTSMFLMAQVQPMRIDHHGWQIFTVVLALIGLVPGRGVRGPAIAGLALAAGLSISLEVLPVTAAFGAVFALRWLGDCDRRAELVAFLVSLAGSVTALFVATRGLGDLAPHCDAVSPALMGLFALAATGSAIVAWVNPQSRLALVAMLAVPLAAGAGFYLSVSPQCLAGPFGNLDPLVREYWYNNISEGRPAWLIAPMAWLPEVAQGLVALAVLAWLGWTRRGDERRWWLEYLLIAAVALVAGLLVLRSLAFVGALSAVPLGWLAGRLLTAMEHADRPLRKVLYALVMLVVLVPVVPLLAVQSLVPGVLGKDEPATALSESCRLDASVAALNRLPPAKILAPFDLGPSLLEQTHHNVVATSHHRAAEAMHDLIAAFLADPREAERIVRANGVEYVFFCADLVETKLYARKSPRGLSAQLMNGRPPGWLERVETKGPPNVQLWRVRAPEAL